MVAKRNVERGAATRVLDYFIQHNGIEVPLTELVSELSLDPAKVKSAIWYIQKNKTDRLQTVHDHLVWKYTMSNQKGGRLFEELAVTKSGLILVQDEAGTIYKLEEM